MTGSSTMHASELFVPLVSYPDPAPIETVPTALAASRHLGADLVGLSLLADIPDVSSPLSRLLLDTPSLIRKAEAKSRKHAVELAGALTKAAEAEGLAVSIEQASVRPELFGETAASRARYADLSFAGWTPGNDAVAMVAEAVLFGSGRPLLLAPAGSILPSLDHVAIAWDGSRVAARALADARDFLARAKRVSVVTVVDEKPLPSDDIGQKLADALKRRGFDAAPISTTGRDATIAETLQKDAAALGAGLLVMGGFGHSRMRDFVLGGATKGVFANLKMPELLSHSPEALGFIEEAVMVSRTCAEPDDLDTIRHGTEVCPCAALGLATRRGRHHRRGRQAGCSGASTVSSMTCCRDTSEGRRPQPRESIEP